MKRKLRKMKTGLVLLMVLGTTASCGGEELKAFVAGLLGIEVVKLEPDDGQATDEFGISVAIDGDYAVVGARLEDGGVGNPTMDGGAVYVYRRTGPDTWGDEVKLLPSVSYGAGDHFGSEVALDGDYLVVGAPTGNEAFVFMRTGENTWDAGTRLNAGGSGALGADVDIDGDYIVAGASSTAGGGAAYVFMRTGANT